MKETIKQRKKYISFFLCFIYNIEFEINNSYEDDSEVYFSLKIILLSESMYILKLSDKISVW